MNLVEQLQQALEQHWDGLANGTAGDEDTVWYIVEELQERGIGAVKLLDMQGDLRWFNLNRMKWLRG